MKSHPNRWLLASAGVIILLFAGLVYAWSVLASPIAEEFPQWTQAQLSLTFTLVMTMFCVGCLVGGFLTAKLKPSLYIMISAAMFLAGFYLTSLSHSLISLYLSFGGLCGFASGFAYNAVMSSIGRWFPDCPGLISGILLMGFGIGAFIIGKVYQAYTPAYVGGWRISFVVLGIVIFIILFLCSSFIRKPDASFVAPAAKAKKDSVIVDLPPTKVLKSSSFWLYYLWAIVISAAGLVLVSQASGIAREVGTQISAATIATVVGLISIFNGIGRVILGGMYDKIGRRFTMQIVNVLFLIASGLLIFAIFSKSFILIIIGFIVGGLAYGGVTPTNSAFTSSYFGQTYYPVNFSLINTNLIIASFGGTVAGALYDNTQSYLSCFFMIIALAVVGILISLAITRIDRRARTSRDAATEAEM